MNCLIGAFLVLLGVNGGGARLDPRGPVFSEAGSPKVGPDGIQMRRAPSLVDPRDNGPRKGSWIWSSAENNDKVVRFLRTVSLKGDLSEAKAWVSSEASYRLWINGRLASRGPADVGRDYDSSAPGPWFDDVRNFKGLFHSGVNVIAAEVFPKALVQSEGISGQPGFKADFRFRFTDGHEETLSTDQQWLSALAPDLAHWQGDHGYTVDLRAEPTSWQTDPTAANWKASVIAPGRAPTIISELPPLMEAIAPVVGVTRVSDSVLAQKGGAAVISGDGGYSVRFGKVLSAYLSLKVRGQAGVHLLLEPSEHDAPGYNRRAEIILRDGVQTVELPYLDSFSVVNITATNVQKPIDILEVRATFASYPVAYKGSFECSRPEWNRLWTVGRWVTQLCMQTHFLDSPHHQEPISDPGDYLIESLNAFYAFGDGTLAKQDLRKFARILRQRNYQNFHTSYALLWLRMLTQYAEFTGDEALLRELAPDVHALLDRFSTYVGANGLISEAPNYMFMDWVEIDGFNCHHPPAVIGQGYMTALYYEALGDDAYVALSSGDADRAAKDESLREKVLTAFNWELWVPGEGLYRDGKPFQTHVAPNQWLPADKNIETFSTQVNTLAVSCGLVDRARSAEIMRKILGRQDMNCQPYFMHFVFEALADSGVYSEFAASQLNRWKIQPDSQSFYEMWNTGDLSHAWNATPVYQLSGRILGVRPLKPGFAEFIIDPIPLDLGWAKGTVPTPFGEVKVSWKRADKGLLIEFTVPKGTVAQVAGRDYKVGRHEVSVP